MKKKTLVLKVNAPQKGKKVSICSQAVTDD